VAAEELAAKRYSQAAFELASEANDTAAWDQALAQMAEFMSDEEVRKVLENSRVEQAAKQRLIDAALGDLPRLPLNLARLLVKKNRTSLANEIARQYRELSEARDGISRAKAITAVELSDQEKGSLTQRLREQVGHEVIVETEVDPSLLGGVVVQIGDRLIDASTRARLEALRSNLVGVV
jgi:F-type H+-transporting ATPase subunit delta